MTEAGAPRIIADRYRVDSILGEGASAITLRAHDTVEDRPVAIKELKAAALDSWKHYELFEREAAVLRALRHHGIPAIYDVFKGEDETGRPEFFVVQELIEGRSLAALIDDGGGMDARELVDVALGLLDVLEYLHGRSPPVYHRDLKPSNVILRPGGQPVLVDFGSVRQGWRPPGEQGMTMVGTAGYMPPEQYLGKVGATTDLYALGATLLHVVTGVFPGELSMDRGRPEIPEGMTVDARLRRLLNGLLQPAPADRPQSASVARDLLLHGPPRGREPSAATPTVRPEDHPQFVDIGPPPRDPKGELAKRFRTRGVLKRLLIWFLVLFLVVGTAGFFAWYLWSLSRSWRRSFPDGEVVIGAVTGIAGAHGERLAYELEHEGRLWRATATVGHGIGAQYRAGDPLPLLLEPGKTARRHFLLFNLPGGQARQVVSYATVVRR